MTTEAGKTVKKETPKQTAPKKEVPATYELQSLTREPVVLNTADYSRGIYLLGLGKTVKVTEAEIGSEIRNAERHKRIKITKL